MPLLNTEFYKLRRKKVGWMVFLVGIFQFVYMIWATHTENNYFIGQEWKSCLYNIFLLNVIIMPLLIAMIASRISDIEHKGNNFKVLRTLVSESKLFNTKVLCGSIYLMESVSLQILAMVAVSRIQHFTEVMDIKQIIYYGISVFVVDFALLLLQFILALTFVNQMVGFIVALVGTFLGLYSMFFGEQISRWILWGYYALIASVRMEWSESTGGVFHFIPFPVQNVAIVGLMIGVLYVVGKSLFVKKEW